MRRGGETRTDIFSRCISLSECNVIRDMKNMIIERDVQYCSRFLCADFFNVTCFR